jgi:hypothetical protein
MTTKISGDNISAIANTGVTWNAVTVADGSTQLNASAGNGYFLDTNAGIIEVFLPSSPTRGDTIVLADYASNFATNNVIVNTGGQLIDSVQPNFGGGGYILSTNDLVVELVYVDSNKGWLVKENEAKNSLTAQEDTNAFFVSATGGTILTSGDYKTHVFTGDGCFVVSCGGNPAGSNTVDYLVVAGGGSSGGDNGGGGGAGGFRFSNSYCLPAPTNSPLANPTGLPVSVTTYPVTVGAGGASGGCCTGLSGPPGSPSVFSTITSAGGGRSAETTSPGDPAESGGSGGGGTFRYNPSGAGNTPPVSPPQGNPGGSATGCGPTNLAGGGGGGAGAAGQNGATNNAGDGGIGSYIDDSFIGPTAPSYGESGPVSSTRYFAGGGGGGQQPGPTSGNQGVGGIGGGGDAWQSVGFTSQTGVTNTGGGAGSGNPGGGSVSGIGGKGIVLIRYKFQ